MQVRKGTRALREHKDLREYLAPKGSRGRRTHEDHEAPRANRETRDSLGPKDWREEWD